MPSHTIHHLFLSSCLWLKSFALHATLLNRVTGANLNARRIAFIVLPVILAIRHATHHAGERLICFMST